MLVSFSSFTQGTVSFQVSMTNSWYCHYWWFNRLFRYSQHLYSLPIPPRYLGPFEPHARETNHVCMSEKPNVYRRHHHNLPSSPIIHPARSPAEGGNNAGYTNQTFTVTRRRHIKLKKKHDTLICSHDIISEYKIGQEGAVVELERQIFFSSTLE